MKELFFDMMGFDWIAEVNYTVTHWATPDHYSHPYGWEPGDPTEIEIDSIHLRLDKGPSPSPEFPATGALYKTILDRISDKLHELIDEKDRPFDF